MQRSQYHCATGKSHSVRFTPIVIFGTETYSPGRDLIEAYVQEIYGGILEDLVEKSRHTVNTGTTSIVMFRGIYDDEQGQGVFDEEERRYWVWAVDDGKLYRMLAKAPHRSPHQFPMIGRCRTSTHQKEGWEILLPLKLFQEQPV